MPDLCLHKLGDLLSVSNIGYLTAWQGLLMGRLTNSKGRKGVLVLDQFRAAIPSLWYEGQRLLEGTLHCDVLAPTSGGMFTRGDVTGWNLLRKMVYRGPTSLVLPGIQVSSIWMPSAGVIRVPAVGAAGMSRMVSFKKPFSRGRPARTVGSEVSTLLISSKTRSACSGYRAKK